MSTDNDVQEMYRSNPLIKSLSELPPHVLAQNLVHLAEWANTNSTKNFLHYRFMPDDPVLELCVHRLTQQGFRLSSEQMAKLTECEEELVEDGDVFEDDVFEDDVFEDDVFEDDVFEDDVFEDDHATETPSKEDEEITVIPHKAPSLNFSPDLSHNLDDEDSGPIHRLIIGDNYQALAGLQAGLATHPKGIYDLIYIDPPYNTGNGDFRYNDSRVDSEDKWRGTKWASFMEPRLILAKRLLKKTGVIFIAIDDNEHHSLRMLCDSVFGRRNFIANLVWDSPGTSGGKAAYGGVDYMLVYTLNQSDHFSSLSSGEWREPRAGQDEMLALVNEVRLAGGTVDQAQAKLNSWIKRAVKSESIAPGTAMYDRVDSNWRVYQSVSLNGPADRPNMQYDITDPTTGKIYPPPTTGGRSWRWSRDKMDKAIAAGDVEFRGVPRRKLYLDDQEQVSPRSVFEKRRSTATDHLANIIGSRQFNFPKDHNVLARWFRMAAPKDAKILDFFGGSGSTAEAVLLLNQQDGGTREVTIVTNDENGIGTEVTRERIVHVMNGEGWADGKKHKGYGGRLGVWFAGTVEVIDFENDREQGEADHHSWDRGAGQWGAWHSTPILLEQTKSYDVYGGKNGLRSVVFHNIDYLNGKLVDEVMGEYPDAQVFLPHSHTYKTVPNSFYVDDVPNAIPLPLGVWSPIQSGVSASVVDAYAKRGGAYVEFIHKLIEQNSATEEQKEAD